MLMASSIPPVILPTAQTLTNSSLQPGIWSYVTHIRHCLTHIFNFINSILFLKLGERDLELYGLTSAFRLAPERSSECSCPEENCMHKLERDNTPVSPYVDWDRHLPPECPLQREEHDKYGYINYQRSQHADNRPVLDSSTSSSNSSQPGVCVLSLNTSFGICYEP